MNEYLLKFTEGFKMFLNLADWAFIVANMMWVLIFQWTIKKTKVKWEFYNKIRNFLPRAYFVLFQSVLLAVFWAWLWKFENREDIRELFVSITISMVVWKMGIHKVLLNIKNKIGIIEENKNRLKIPIPTHPLGPNNKDKDKDEDN